MTHEQLQQLSKARLVAIILRQIATTDSADVAKATLAKSALAIDNLVYELYNLTDEEIAIVEAATEQG